MTVLQADTAIVVDFDNTITDADVGDMVADEFGDGSWRERERAHERGELSLMELLRYMFESMRVSETELVAFVRRVARVRPGFREFLLGALARGWHVTLASGGLDVYVLAILGSLARDMDLRTNVVRFEEDRVRVEFPYSSRGCGDCGNCKGAVVEELRERGYRRVIAVGDGTSDRCMARAADVVFARGTLLSFCRREGLPATAFENFHEVTEALGSRG